MNTNTDDLTRDYFTEHDPVYDDDISNMPQWRIEMIDLHMETY